MSWEKSGAALLGRRKREKEKDGRSEPFLKILSSRCQAKKNNK